MIELIKEANGVATVLLNRPEKHNAFDEHLIADMTSAFSNVDTDNSVRVMVLAANGKSFSAGGDLAWMQRMASYNYAGNLKDARGLAEMLRVFNTLSKPSIAKIQGAAYGGAVGLVSCCDIAVASEKASFCLSEVKIGLAPATISPYVINAIGERATRRYAITAERFSAEQAHKLGLLSEVCPAEELDQRVNAFIELLLANSPQGITATKQLIRDVSKATPDSETIEMTCNRIASIRVSDEGQEGLSAFLEKRSPAWQNKT